MQFAYQNNSAPYNWVQFTGSFPQGTVYASDTYAIIRAAIGQGDSVVGKYHLQQHQAYIPYGGKETPVNQNIEILVAAPGTKVSWVQASHGSLPNDAIGPIGKDGLYVGRAVAPQPENKHTPGKIQPSHKCLYMPWGGKEERFDNYEVLVIKREHTHQQWEQPTQTFSQGNVNVVYPNNQGGSASHRWEQFTGSLPQGTVYTSDTYAVIRADVGQGDKVVGKYHLGQRKAYIPYGGKEVSVDHNVEVLVSAPGAKVTWITSSQGFVVEGAVGPIGKDGLYVGRAVCPQPENKHTPGKIHPGHKCLYMPWGGKEERFDNYEVCVIKFESAPQHWQQQQQQQQQYQYQQPSGNVIFSQGNAYPNQQYQQVPTQQFSQGNVYPNQQYQQAPTQQFSQGNVPQYPQFQQAPTQPFSQGNIYPHGGGNVPQYQQVPTQQFSQLNINSGPSHFWQKFTGSFPQGTVYASDVYAVIRAEVGHGDPVVGKYHLGQRQAYIPYGGKEVAVNQNVEILVAAPGTKVSWVQAARGSIPNDAIGPIGKDGVFVGRAVCPQPENKHTPGKIHLGHRCLYMPWSGKEERFDNYEVCVINREAPFRWEKLFGALPQGTVYASDTYAIIRVDNGGGHMTIGKYHLGQNQAYIPYGGKEVAVNQNVEVLVAAPGAHIQWLTGSHGSIADGAIGPIGNESLYVGRAMCPQPENKYTPGKIHPGHKCLYMPWGGQEKRYDAYEVCVIRF